jgi:hypothetical protein
MPDVVHEESHKNQVKQHNAAKMFHYTSAPPKAHTQKINGLARYVANVFSPYCSSWARVSSLPSGREFPGFRLPASYLDGAVPLRAAFRNHPAKAVFCVAG